MLLVVLVIAAAVAILALTGEIRLPQLLWVRVIAALGGAALAVLGGVGGMGKGF